MSDLVGNPEDRFSRVEAQMIYIRLSDKHDKLTWMIKNHLSTLQN